MQNEEEYIEAIIEFMSDDMMYEDIYWMTITSNLLCEDTTLSINLDVPPLEYEYR